MAQIKTLYAKDKDLTFHKIKGLVSAEELIDTMKAFYAKSTTLNVLLDLTEADLSKISTDELRRIISEVRMYADARQGGKTALVFYTDLEYGLGRMVEAFAEIENMPYEFRSYRSMEKAEEWLGINIASILIKSKKKLQTVSKMQITFKEKARDSLGVICNI